MSFVFSVGTCNVDLLYAGLSHVPQEGEEVFSKGFSLQLGGGAPGTAVNLKRLGVPVHLGTYLGTDLFSEFAARELKKNGVDAVNLRADGAEGIPVNVSTAMLTKNDRTFVSYGCRQKETTKLDNRVSALASGAKIVQMQYGMLPVWRKLKKEGCTLVFDIGWTPDMSLRKYAPYLELADYFTPNIRETIALSGRKSPEEGIYILAEYVKNPIVKLDRFGCMYLEDGKIRKIKCVPDVVCADSTGAGDAFLAGFMYGLYHGRPVPECVLYGNIAGGKCVTGLGCLTEFETEESLKEKAEKYAYLAENA